MFGSRPSLGTLSITTTGEATSNMGITTTFANQLLGCIDGYKVDDAHIGLPGWEIRLQRADGTGPIYSVLTNSSGYFRFDELEMGEYRLWEIVQSGWIPVTAAEFTVPLTQGGDECVTVRFKNRPATPRPPGTHWIPLIFRWFYHNWRTPTPSLTPPPPTGNACVEGYKRDSLGVGLAGWVIKARVSGQPWPEYVGTTDGLGHFRIGNLPAGTYEVFEELQPRWVPNGPVSYTVMLTETQCITLTFVNQQTTPTPTATATWTPTPAQTPTPTPTQTPSPTAIPTQGPSVIAGLIYPKALAVNQVTARLYVVSRETDQVYVLSSVDHHLLGIAPTGRAPFGIALNGLTNKVYVGNFKDNSVTVVDGANNTVIKTIPLAPYGEPSWMATDPIRNRIYVALHDGGRLGIIDGASDTLLTTVEVGAGAFGVAVHPTLNRVYVSLRDVGAIRVVDALTSVVLWEQTIFLRPGNEPYALALDQAANRLYTNYAEHLGGHVNRLAAFELTASGGVWLGTVAIGDSSGDGGGLAVNPNTGNLFVVNPGDNTVSVVHRAPFEVATTVPVGLWPFGVAADPATNLIYVGNRNSNDVYFFPDLF